MSHYIALILTAFLTLSLTAQNCVDLGGVDFGDCEMAMGIALVDGECISLSGCGWEVGGVDYSPYSFDTYQACEACNNGGCMDVGGIDFGLCDMALGLALVNGSCISVSGCGWEVGGIDYSPYFYQDLADCEACMTSACIDMQGVDFGACENELGVGLINGSCSYISGCSWMVNDTDYSVYAFDTMEACQLACDNSEDCLDLGGIDFGPCDAVMGIGIVNGICIEISGCGWEVGGVDYSPYSFESFEDCETLCGGCYDLELIGQEECVWGVLPEPVCGCDGITYWNACVAMYEFGITAYSDGPCSCPDISIIDPLVLCPAVYDPVCGCDGATYSNSCIAWYSNGITEWIMGECSSAVAEDDQLVLNVWSMFNGEVLAISTDRRVVFEVLDVSGKSVLAGSLSRGQHQLNISDISKGVFIFKAFDGQVVGYQRFIR